MGWAIWGLPKCRKFTCLGHTFGGCWLLLILMMVATQKYVQLIIQSLLYISMVWAIGDLPKFPEFILIGDTFGGCCLLFIFNTKVCSVDHIIIVVYINGVSHRGSSEMSQIWVQWSHF